MKKLLYTFAGSVSAIALISFTLIDNSLTIDQAVAENKVVVTLPEFGSNGYYSGLRVNIKNISGKSLQLKIPKGTIFIPDNTGEQTLTTSEDTVFALNSNQEKQVRRQGFCTEIHDHGSTSASTFTLGFTKNSKLLNILNYMDSLHVNDHSIVQHAVWCITDNNPVSYITMKDTAVERKLRLRICSLTGQSMPWYSTESEIVRRMPDPVEEEEQQEEIVQQPRPVFVIEAHTVTGDLHFTSTTRTELQGMVKDSTGKVISTSPRKMTCPPGNVTFEYKLTVQGWAKGKYSVVYLNNGVEVINQPFEI
jgi:hypothetical protein